MSARTSLRVLVVDAYEDARDSLDMLLRLLGHEVRAARDGPAALAEGRAFAPDVVLLEVRLPGEVDGWEVGRRLREQSGGRPLLLVALTVLGRQQDRARSAEAGFDAHLTKPVDPEELQALLAGCVPAGAA